MSHPSDGQSSNGLAGGFFATFLNKDNSTPGYERFYYAKRYIRSKSEANRSKEDHRRIGQALGYNTEKGSFHFKLTKRRKDYDALNGDIPLAYLDAIGAKMAELETCIEADVDLFEREKQKPRYPRKAIIRYAACVYGTFAFPDGTCEAEALRMLIDSEYAGLQCLISYPELLVISCTISKSSPFYGYVEPRYERWKDRLHIHPLPVGLGVTRV